MKQLKHTIKFGDYIEIFNFTKNIMLTLDEKYRTEENIINIFNFIDKHQKTDISFSISNNHKIDRKLNIEFDDINIGIGIPKLNICNNTMKKHLIACIGNNFELGNNNNLIWNIKNDLNHFKKLTMNHFILMGRKTFESLPKILPNRIHVVISSDYVNLNNLYKENTNVYFFSNILEAETFINKTTKIYLESPNLDFKKYIQNKFYIIGGGEIYKNTINSCHQLEITKVKNDYIGDCDTYFPEIKLSYDSGNQFSIIKSELNEDNINGSILKYYFLTLRNNILIKDNEIEDNESTLLSETSLISFVEKNKNKLLKILSNEIINKII